MKKKPLCCFKEVNCKAVYKNSILQNIEYYCTVCNKDIPFSSEKVYRKRKKNIEEQTPSATLL